MWGTDGALLCGVGGELKVVGGVGCLGGTQWIYPELVWLANNNIDVALSRGRGDGVTDGVVYALRSRADVPANSLFYT